MTDLLIGSDEPVPESRDLAGRASRAGLAERAAVGVGAFVVVGALAGADGGYFPVSWGWAGMSLAWLAATALLFRAPVSFSRLGLLLVGGLTAFLAWTVLSVAWSDSATRTMLEAERTLVYVAAAIALLALGSRGVGGALLGGTLAGIVGACVYALGTRTTPERFAISDSIAGYRLSQPVGYWNGLGLLAALGILLAVGFVARGRALAVRMLAAASLPLLATTLYLTFSRGAWIALALGLAAAVGVDPKRLQLIVALLAAVPGTALAVWFAASSPAFTSITAPDVDAVREGHRLAIVVLGMTALSAFLCLALVQAEARIRISRGTTRLFARGLLLLLLAGLLGVFVRFGMPWTIAASLKESFSAPPTVVRTSLNERLFTLSGSGRSYQWRVAADTFAEQPLIGVGAGTYEYEWLQRRTVPGKVRDAHSLYLETLAELGVVGLLLLAAALVAPLLAIPGARRRRLVPFAVGGYVALLAHAAVDWDWELPVLIVAGLVLGVVTIVASGPEEAAPAPPGLRWGLAAAAVVVGVLSFLGLLGNAALADSRRAASDGRWQDSAERARDAARWAPWSSEAWRRAALAQGTAKAARPLFLRAIRKDPRNWELRLELAWASKGEEREQALRAASMLNPLSPEVAAYRRQLAEEKRAAP